MERDPDPAAVLPPQLQGLLVTHLPALKAFVAAQAGRALLRREAVSDLTQSVCREVLRLLQERSPSFVDEDEFWRWLRREAWQKVTERARFHAAARRREAADPPAEAAEQTDALTPSGLVELHEDRAELRAALSELRPEDRELIRLAYFEQLPRAELGRRIGKGLSATKMALARATARLARYLV